MCILCDGVAKPPLKLMRRDNDGNIDEATSHPLYRLLKYNPSSLYTSFNWRWANMNHTLLTGNALNEIVRNRDGSVKELILIDPHDFDGVELVQGKLMYRISGKEQMYSPERFLHFMGPTNNGLMGMNIIEAHRMTFASDMGSRRFSQKLWENGAMPSGVIEHPGDMGDGAYARLKSSWQKEYSGAANAGKTVILEEGAKYHQLSMTPLDAGWIQSRKDVVEEISRIFGVPLHMLSSLDEATFNNIEHLTLSFLRDSMQPWYERFTSELNRKLLSPREQFNYFFQFDTSGLEQAPLEVMAEFYVKMFNIGVLNRDEIRRMIGKNAVEDGSRYYVQGNNMVPVDAIDELLLSKTTDSTEDAIDVPTVTEGN